jgi:hypothetical protein
MTASGHSRPAPTSIKFCHVRYAPKATDSRFLATCRYGPNCDICNATIKHVHSITSSTVASSVCGTVWPSALAALKVEHQFELRGGSHEQRSDPGADLRTGPVGPQGEC